MERRNHLLQQIKETNDEQTIDMLKETRGFYPHHNSKDITDNLEAEQLNELSRLMSEPAEKDTISEEEFRKSFARWHTK